MNDAPPTLPQNRAQNKAQTSLQDALELLAGSPLPTLPIVDPDTGQVLAVLARPEAVPLPEPPRLGGMATPLGVYLHDGVSSGGAGFWGLFLTGVTLSLLALTAQAGAHGAGAGGVRASAPCCPLARRSRRPACGSGCRPFRPGCRCRLCFCSCGSSRCPAPMRRSIRSCIALKPMRRWFPEQVRAMPRVHPRCGTNLFAGFSLFLLTFLTVFCVVKACRLAACWTAFLWPPCCPPL